MPSIDTHERRSLVAASPVRMPLMLSEADKYRWIRANRHSLDLLDALREAAHDVDFDMLVETAMRMSVASPSYFGAVGGPPLRPTPRP